jgi:hypothetical protein
MKGRRRLSSDGLKLFNMAVLNPPRKSKVKELLSCLFRTEYDDQLDQMVMQCREASKQIFMLANDKSINTDKLLNNAIFNLIYAILSKDDKITSKRNIKKNIRYFWDVLKRAYNEDDHNTAILLKSVLEHVSIQILKIKERSSDVEIKRSMEDRYGSWRDCYKHHLKEVMQIGTSEDYLPSLMVLNMHASRTSIYENITRCRFKYTAEHIRSKLGLFRNLYPLIPHERMALYEEPPVKSNVDLMVIVNNI